MTQTAPVDLAGNAARIRDRIATAAQRAGRDPSQVQLIAVSKTHGPQLVATAARAGLTTFGENRVQEAATKVPAVASLLGVDATIEWHMIGHLQTNKAGQAAELFSMVESVDSLKLARALDRRANALGAKRLAVLLEVYVGDDPERPGFRADRLAEEAAQIVELPGLEVRGLMTVAPLGLDEAAIRAAFTSVRELRDQLASAYPRVHFGDLSMGMSDDFELAVEEGSTMVRIGRAIFGSRE